MDYMGTNKQAEKFESNTKKVKSGIFNNIGNIATVLIGAAFLFQGFFKPGLSDVPLILRLVNSALSMFVAVAISSSMGLQAIITSNSLQTMIDIREEHIKIVESANEYAEYADEWADYENSIAYKKARTYLLSIVGLKYSDYFDESGAYTEKLIPNHNGTKASIRQYKARERRVEQCLGLELTPISFLSISSEGNSDLDYNNTGVSPMIYQRNSVMKKIVGSLASIIILGNITFSLIEGKNVLEALFNGGVQLFLFVIWGSIEYLKNWNYNTITHKGNIRKKINLNNRLISYGKQKRGELNGNKI